MGPLTKVVSVSVALSLVLTLGAREALAQSGQAPADATYLTMTPNRTLTQERALGVPSGSAILSWDAAAAAFKWLSVTSNLAIVGGSLTALTGPITTRLVLTNPRPFAFPVEEGTPGAGTVNMIQLGGTTDADLFLSAEDGQPGYDDHTQGRKLITYSRRPTAALPLSGVSNVLAGFVWNGASAVLRAIELENKVSAVTGAAEFWVEELTETGGYPFIKFFREPSSPNSGAIVGHENPTDSLRLGAFDTDQGIYKFFMSLAAGVTPSLTIAPPPGGKVSVQANEYKSSDGTVGVTVTTCTAFKNGLCVAGY